MKKFLILLIVGISALTLTSCKSGGDIVQELENKYPIDEYLNKGAILVEYGKNGAAIMKDTNGDIFYAGYNSTYPVKLDDNGIILPVIIYDNKEYYYETTINERDIQNNIGDNKKASFNLYSNSNQSTSTLYLDINDTDIIYTKSLEEGIYVIWRNY